MRSPHALVSGAFFLLLLSACSTGAVKPSASAEELRKNACNLEQPASEVRGSVWIHAKSADSAGQFPAEVLVTPQSLRLEVTNLVGGREALITVEGTHYTVEREGKIQKGRKSWGGIPLEWAHELFLGRIPCPAEGVAVVSQSVNSDGDLAIETVNHERFLYRFRSWSGRPWPEFVRWESGQRSSHPLVVEFEFQDPEDKSGLAKIWTAKSARGEVKVRWKNRETR